MRLTALACLLPLCGEAAAQVSGSVSLVSNYVYRGVSLSNGNPEPQLNLTADFDSGWFAGGFLTPVDIGASHAQAIAYGGYARQLNTALSWEAGVSESAYAGGGSGQNYGEVFAGLSSERLNGRLYYSPNYLGQGVHSFYGEINANLPLNASWRAVAHAGYLSVQQADDEHANASHGDLRVGLAYHAGDWNLQWALASVRESRTNAYHYQHVTQHYAGVLDASWNF